MKRKSVVGTIFYSLGDLRIAGPEEEVTPFLEWLKEQKCHIFGTDEVQAIKGHRSIDISIDIYPEETKAE